MKVFVVYHTKDDCSSEVIKVFRTQEKAIKFLNDKNESREFHLNADGSKNYYDCYEWDEFEIED